MSKLSDAIRRAQRIDSAPMGFGAARAAPKATMLVALLAAPAALSAEDRPDIFIVDGRGSALTADQVTTARTAAGDAPLGAWLGELGRDAATELHKAGLDFVVFSPEATLAEALLVEDLGYVLTLPQAPEESYLRILEGLALDAVWLTRVPSPLTVAGQLDLNKVGLFGRRPLVCEVGATASSADLECLRAAGVAVVVVGQPQATASLKETIMALPARRQRREDRPAVALPRQATPVESDDEEEE